MEIWKRAFPLTLRMSGQKRSIFFEKNRTFLNLVHLSGGLHQGIHASKYIFETMKLDALARCSWCGWGIFGEDFAQLAPGAINSAFDRTDRAIANRCGLFV